MVERLMVVDLEDGLSLTQTDRLLKRMNQQRFIVQKSFHTRRGGSISAVILQIHVLICFVLVILQRVVNLMVPYQIGRVVDALVQVVDAVSHGEPLTM